MSNEELAELVKAGYNENLPVLWEKMKGYIYKVCTSYYNRLYERMHQIGITVEDMTDEAYLYLFEACKAYDPERGKFISFFGWYLKRMVAELTGSRKGRSDAFFICDRLDETIGNDSDGLTFADTVKDKTLNEAFDEIDKKAINGNSGL